MRFLNILILLFALIFPGVSHAEEPTIVHPIDKFHKSCIDKETTTAGMNNCTYKAYEMWDQELNKSYHELMDKLTPQSKQILKNSQREWMKFRDKEFQLIEQIYSQLEGTMYIPMLVNSRLVIVKQRTLQLKEHLNLLKK